MTFVILAAGIDLSVGSVLAFAATLSAVMLMRGGYGTPETVIAVLLAGLLIGVVNAVVITKGRIQSFVVTLAMMSAARGLARLVSGGSGVEIGYGEGGAPQSFALLGGKLGAFVPVPALIFLATVVIAWVVLNKTRFGRYVHATGSNELATRLSGVTLTGQVRRLFDLQSARGARRHHPLRAARTGQPERRRGLRAGRDCGGRHRRHVSVGRHRNRDRHARRHAHHRHHQQHPRPQQH